MMNNKIIPSVQSKESYFSPRNTAETTRIESRDRKEEFGNIFESIQDKKHADNEAEKVAEKKAKQKEDGTDKTSSEKSDENAAEDVSSKDAKSDSDTIKEVVDGQSTEDGDQGEEAKEATTSEEDKAGKGDGKPKTDEGKLKASDTKNAQADKPAGEAKPDKTSAAGGEKKTEAADGHVEQQAGKMPGEGEGSVSKENSGEEKQQAQPVSGEASTSTEGKQTGDVVNTPDTKEPDTEENAEAKHKEVKETSSSAAAKEAGTSENTIERSDHLAADRAASPVTPRNGSNEQASTRPAELASRKGPSFLAANVVNEADNEAGDEAKKLIYSLFGKQETADSLEKSVAIRGIKAEHIREKRNKNHLASFAKRGAFSTGRNGVSAGGSSSSNAKPEMLNSVSQMVLPTSGSEASEDLMSSDKDLLWKEHTMETLESKDNKAGLQNSGFSRLEQMPVSNISIRRNVLPGLTQTVLKAAGGTKSSPESWQKHNFVLEDGKNVRLTSRKIDGVLQIKLGSSFQELNRLLQQYADEIRAHLEKECDLEIDLQFDGQEEGNLSEFFGDSSQPNGRSNKNTKDFGVKTSAEQIEKVLPKSVRKFGYNQMEWTA